MLRQDCCLILPPYQFSLGDPSAALVCPWRSMARAPSAVLQVHLRPQNGRHPKNPSWTRGPDDLEATLVFFSTFEELKLPATGPMDRATTKLYEASPTPILYVRVAPCELMLGRVPLFPCFLQGNTTPTIPHKLRALGRRGVKRPAAAARQLGAEMNETHGPSTSGGISQDIPGYASL